MTATPGMTRRTLLAGLGTAALGGAMAGAASAGPAPDDDASLLGLALGLEHLQAAFYGEAVRLGALPPTSLRAAAAVAGVERAHVAAVTDALGARAQAPPLFSFGDATGDREAFERTAVALEDLAAATQLGLLPLIADPGLRRLLAEIRTVDAGHAAWLRLGAGVPPVADARDAAMAADEAVALLRRAGIATARPAAPADDRWRAVPGPGPELLTALPLARAPRAAAPEAAPAAPAPPPGPPWTAWLLTTAGLSTVTVAGIGLAARRKARQVTVVGPDEGPVISQHAAPAPGVADRPAAAQTARVRRPPPRSDQA